MKMFKLKNLTPLDKVILANLKMIENEIGIACSLSICMLFSFLFIVFIIGLPVEFALAIYFFIKAYKKVFYTSIYGETAAFYHAFPINAKDYVVGKISAVFTGTFIYIVVTLLCFVPFINLWNLIKDSIPWGVLSMKTTLQLSAALSLELIALIAVSLALITTIFLSITLYMEDKLIAYVPCRKGIFIVLTTFFCMTVLHIETITDQIGLEYKLWIPLLQTAIAVVVTYFAGKKTIAVFEEKGCRG